MDLHGELPHPVDAEALLALSDGHHDRAGRPLETREPPGVR
ncbi:hypothetical protein [Streptomyces sp. NPDC014995]